MIFSPADVEAVEKGPFLGTWTRRSIRQRRKNMLGFENTANQTPLHGWLERDVTGGARERVASDAGSGGVSSRA